MATKHYLAYPRSGGKTILAVDGEFPHDTHVCVAEVVPIEDGHYAAEYGEVYDSNGIHCGLLPEKHPARDRLPKKDYEH